jgi:lipid II:glycine glycyltransferase (peptidoglycan interpeptide bridge formation enzyme)
MRFEKLDAKAYTKIIQSYPKKKWPIEQSPAWGDFQHQVPGREYLGTFVLLKDDAPVALATLLQLHMRGYSFVWINQGPVWLREPTATTVKEVVDILRHLVKTTCNNSPLFIRAHLPSPTIGAVEAHSKALVEKTTIVDLTPPFEEVLARMNYGARRGMRNAEKARITVREVPRDEAIANFATYYAILRETTSRSGFFGHPEQTYKTMLETLGEHARLFAAFNQENKSIAWALDTVYAGHAIYYYGASNEEARRASAPYLMQIKIMEQLKTEGVKTYDFLGIGSKNYPGLQGVTQFKLRFGGEVVDYTPIYDIPLNSLRYKLWVQAQKVRYKLHHLK